MSNRRVIFSVTHRYMKLNRRRTVITFLGIMLMVMMMTCVFVGKDTVVGYMQEVASLDKGSWHVIAYDVPAEAGDELMSSDEVTVSGRSVRLGYADFPQSGSELTPYLSIKAYSEDAFEMMNIRLAQGRLPKSDTELVISRTALEDGASLKLGDTIDAEFFERYITNHAEGSTIFPDIDFIIDHEETVQAPDGLMWLGDNEQFTEEKKPTGESAVYTVVGIIESPSLEWIGGSAYAAFTLPPDGAPVSGRSDIIMQVSDNTDVYAFRQDIYDITGEYNDVEINDMVLAFSGNSADNTINAIVAFMAAFFTVLIIAASVVLIYNVFNMSYRERTKYLGMLSSVGATRKQKRWSVYFESLYLLIPAVPVGIVIGLVVIKLAMLALSPYIDKMLNTLNVLPTSGIPVRLSVNVTNILIIIGISTLTVFISAFIPAHKIGRIGAIESIRGNSGRKKRYRTKMLRLSRGDYSGLLASCSISRSRYLTRGIVRSIAVFMAMTMITAFSAFTVIRIMDFMVDNESQICNIEGYDYVVEGGIWNKDAYNSVRDAITSDSAVDGYTEILKNSFGASISREYVSDEYLDAFHKVLMAYTPREEEFSQNDLWGVSFICFDDDIYADIAKNCGADMNIANDTSRPSVILYQEARISTDNVGVFGEEAEGFKIYEIENVINASNGDTLPLEVYDYDLDDDMRTVNVTVAGSAHAEDISKYYSFNTETIWVIANRSAIELIGIVDYDLLFSLKDGEGESLISHIKQIDNENGYIYLSRADTLNGELSFRDAIVSIIHILAYCFIAMISLICLLNLYNSVKSRAMERRRDIATLRSVGMTSGQIRLMLMKEDLRLWLRSLAIAAIISVPLIWLVGRTVQEAVGYVKLNVPIWLPLSTALGALAVLVAITAASYRFHKSEILVEEMRNENL